MTLQQRKEAFKSLGKYLLDRNPLLEHVINTTHITNPWFTAQMVSKAVFSWGKLLNETDLSIWLPVQLNVVNPKLVGLVLAGNIPMVGFHDILSVLATGHIALIKSSSQDKILIPHILNKLIEIEPAFVSQIKFTERLENFDAVIATGSNNTSRYFEYYFGKVPNLIRKNRNSVAILSGEETRGQLSALGNDIFDYYGLGCRNISKVFVPSGYNFSTFFESIKIYKDIINHNKYCNNYEYNKSIYLINSAQHFDNGFLLVKKDEHLASPLAVLHYEEYQHLSEAESSISNLSDQVQCVVTASIINVADQQVNFGESQQPKLWDYADGVNTIDFLLSL